MFEKNKQLGGNWVYDEQNSHSSVYETTHIISSKRWSEFVDFPMPAAYPDYPSHRQLLDYFTAYADHFALLHYIRFNTEVIKVFPAEADQWQIIYVDSTGTHEEVFDYLLVANGHHWDPLLPVYPGNFTGDILHSHQYKNARPFQNKRVLVVGGGNSACDIAVEISRIAPGTCISVRRGHHIFPKFIFGKPTDDAVAKIRWLPPVIRQKCINWVMRILQGRYAKYKLPKPACGPLEMHPTINSELLYAIRHGKVATRPAIAYFAERRVYFVDGSSEEFDTVNLCYRLSY